MKKYLTLLLVMNAYLSKAQNNAIFNGGAADGFDRSGYAQAGNNIFTGGANDGWHYAGFAQTTNNIFKGGDGDGWNFAAYAQAGNNIFVGGTTDGWSFNAFALAGNGIFIGGQGDGWGFNRFLQFGHNVFVGGQGDGWASTYRPLGVLPVTFTGFTAEKKGATALLKWQTEKEKNAAWFDVERSADAVRFTKTGTVAATGSTNEGASYQWVDAQPLRGYNYYRLKQIDQNGDFVYTPVRTVVFDGTLLQTIKAYPVPATNLVTVALPPDLRNEDLLLNLSNAAGLMVQQVKLSRSRISNLYTLKLSALPAGVYTLQVATVSFSGSCLIIKQ